MAPAIKLRFGKPSRGWLPATLTIGAREHAFDVSYFANDFLADLAAALSGVLESPGEHVAQLCEEPAEYTWRFEAVGESTVAFGVVSYPDEARERGEVVVEVRGAPLTIVRPLWRGLRELASRAQVDAFRAHWGERFPHEAIGRLSEQVERLEAAQKQHSAGS